MKQKHVLVLGDFSAEGRQRIDAIKSILSINYLPLLLSTRLRNILSMTCGKSWQPSHLHADL